jgi:hypothetical protein
MGGAFVGVADDASAVFINPAGISVIYRPEVLAEFRTSSPASVDLPLARGAVSSEASAALTTLAFAVSFGRSAIGVYHLETGASRSSFSPTPGGGTGVWRTSNALFDNSATGGTLAFILSSRLAVGTSVGVRRLLSATHAQFAPDGKASTCDFSLIDRGISPEWSIGALGRMTNRLSLGAALRSGSTVTLKGNLNGCGGPPSSPDLDFVTPRVIAFGASFRLLEPLKIAAEVRRVYQSQTVTPHYLVFEGLADTTIAVPEDFSVADGTSLHFGGSYMFLEFAMPVEIRAGYFRLPSTAVQYSGRSGTISGLAVASAGNTSGYSLSFGVAPSRNLEANLAVVESAGQLEVTAGILFRLPD